MLDRLAKLAAVDPRVQLGGGSSSVEINALAERLGVLLPVDYVEFLRRWGWASIGPTGVLGIGPDTADHCAAAATECMRDASDDYAPSWRPGHVVINHVGNGDVRFLRTELPYRGLVPVLRWDHELDEELITALSFSAWIDAILRDPDFIPPGPMG